MSLSRVRNSLPLTRLRTLAVWGPGLLVTLADTDVGNIITAAQAGTQWGYRLLGLVLILISLLYMVQWADSALGNPRRAYARSKVTQNNEDCLPSIWNCVRRERGTLLATNMGGCPQSCRH